MVEPINSEKIQSRERLAVRIPEKVKRDLKNGVESVLDRIASYSPEKIIVLQRAGSLAFTAVEAEAQKRGLELPPVIQAPIGREMTARFERNLARTKEKEGVDIYAGGGFRLKEYPAELEAWLGQDTIAQQRVTSLAEKIGGSKKILIVDDVRFSQEFEGGTINTLAPAMVRKAAKGEVEIQTELLLENTNWLSSIIRASTQGLSPTEEAFFRHLITGFRKTETEITKIQTNEDLALLGEQIANQPGKEANPYPNLAKRYGDQALLDFYSQTTKALQGQ